MGLRLALRTPPLNLDSPRMEVDGWGQDMVPADFTSEGHTHIPPQGSTTFRPPQDSKSEAGPTVTRGTPTSPNRKSPRSLGTSSIR